MTQIETLATGSESLSTIANTAFLLGGLFFVAKGIQMVVTGKNSFKKESFT